MSQKRLSPWGNPEFRHRTQRHTPAVEPIEPELLYLLSPATFKPPGDSIGKGQLRNRRLTLAVMMD
jgi:hypothetical protein